MLRTLSLAGLLALGACSPVMKMPGPPGVVGRPAPGRAPLPLAAEVPAEAVVIAEPTSPSVATPKTPGKTGPGTDLARAAEHYLEKAPRGYRNDCSGFVCAAANLVGLPLESNTAGIWALAKTQGAVHHRKRPRVGDLAFFDNTYDRNRNGRLDDELTHIGIVVEVHRDGRLLVAHAGTSRGRTTMWMNLQRPDIRHDEAGVEHNGMLRARTRSDPKRTKHLAGELWRGFATVDEAWFDAQQTAQSPR